ncbi:hypothetical protein MAR_035578 [Mya arenaria]|uniref:Uncharacterized protein n=1 Tax=Mya arenaria TaxID=6604 RepID=A0ABY7EN90_MYAAR|nr:hypothetical protein MAR_035578 [Mya arenaria]
MRCFVGCCDSSSKTNRDVRTVLEVSGPRVPVAGKYGDRFDLLPLGSEGRGYRLRNGAIPHIFHETFNGREKTDHAYASDQLQVANELKKSGATTAKPQMFNVQCQTTIWPLCSTSYETKGVGTEITTQDMGAQTDHDCISTPGSLYTLDDSDSDWAPDSPPSAANMPCSEHEEAKQLHFVNVDSSAVVFISGIATPFVI